MLGSSLALVIAAARTNVDTYIALKKQMGVTGMWSDILPTNNDLKRLRYFELHRVSKYACNNTSPFINLYK